MSEPAVTEQILVQLTTRARRMFSWSALIGALGLLVILIPAAYITAANLPNTYDDALITYRYAYNVASGVGFVYNPGEWFLGTTAPLYGLLLGCIGFLVGPNNIPLISAVISGLSLALTGAVLYRLDRTLSSALLLALATLTRPDGLLAAVVIGVHFLVTRRRIPWREAACTVIILLPFVLLAWA